MDINDDGCTADLTNVKGEAVIRSFRWKDDFYAYAFTSIKRRLDEVKIRRLNLKLWKLSSKFSSVVWYLGIYSLRVNGLSEAWEVVQCLSIIA